MALADFHVNGDLPVKNPPAKAGGIRGAGSIHPWVGKMPGRKKWQPPPVFWPGESRGQRSLAGYGFTESESDTTEAI